MVCSPCKHGRMVCSPGKPDFARENERNKVFQIFENVENGVVLSYLRSDEHVI